MDLSMLNRFGCKFHVVLKGTTKSLSRFGAFLLIVMMVLVATDAFSRYIFNNSIKGVIDIVELTLLFVVFLSVAEVAVKKGHVAVDLVVSRFSKHVRNLLNAIVSFASMIISILIAWQMGNRGIIQINSPTQYTQNLEMPLGPFLLIAAFGVLVLSLVLLADFVQYLAAWINKKN